MSLIKSKFPEHSDRQLEADKATLPEGTIITGNQAVISDKSLALSVYDNDCAVFITDKNGRLQLLTDRNDIVNHSGTYTVSTADLELVLERDRKREQEKPQEKSESEKIAEQTELAMAEISAFTGVSLTQLQALPIDIKNDIITTYQQNVNALANDELVSLLNSVLEGKPIAFYEQAKEEHSPVMNEKGNYLKTVEELVEGNYNSIDGVINNLPPDSENERPSVLAALKELAADSPAAPPQSQSLDIGGDERQR